VAIINEATAREYWPGESPIGRRIQRGGPNKRPWSTIVGVVQDVKVRGPDRETPPEMYLPHTQFLLVPNSRLAIPNMTLVVRSNTAPALVIPPVRAQIRTLNKDALITNVEFMEDALARVIAPRELNTAIFGIFAFVALSLAVVGVYGVVSYSVARRSQEIGVRVAMGAQRWEVLVLVLRQGLRLVLIGIAAGIVGAFLLTRWMSNLLFEVHPADPLTLTAMALLLLAVSFAACYLPARRAFRLDPLVVLREE
jgi:putative ABC transport system permease protein